MFTHTQTQTQIRLEIVGYEKCYFIQWLHSKCQIQRTNVYVDVKANKEQGENATIPK